MNNAQQIKQCILDIGKASIIFNENTHDFVFNNKNPREIPADYYYKLYLKFVEHLKVQLKENCTEALLNKYINYAETEKKKVSGLIAQHRVSFLFMKSKNQLSDAAEYTHTDINTRLSIQIATLNYIIKKLVEEMEFVGYKTSEDYKKEVGQIDTLPIEQIPFTNVGKATFHLSKKEVLMLLYIMEETKLLEFTNDAQRNKFIENNFNYFEKRENPLHGAGVSMRTVNSDFSNLKSYHVGKSNNKTWLKLQEKLENMLFVFKFPEKKKSSQLATPA